MSDTNLRRFSGQIIDVSNHIKNLYAAARSEGYQGNVRDFMHDRGVSRFAVQFSSAVGFGMRTEVGAFMAPALAKDLKIGQKVTGEAILLDAGCFVRKFG